MILIHTQIVEPYKIGNRKVTKDFWIVLFFKLIMLDGSADLKILYI